MHLLTILNLYDLIACFVVFVRRISMMWVRDEGEGGSLGVGVAGGCCRLGRCVFGGFGIWIGCWVVLFTRRSQ